MSKIVFGWAAGAQHRVSAQVAGERIEKIRKERGGQVTRADVLDDARDERSPLHVEFEWDDARAAEEHRLSQAGQILRHIVVTTPSDDEVRHYVVIARAEPDAEADRGRVGIYATVESAMKNPESRAYVLERALAELDAFKRKYALLEELSEVFDAAARVAARKKRKRAA